MMVRSGGIQWPPLTLREYQIEAMETAVYPPGLEYPILGLAEEAGEVAGKYAKVIRDQHGELLPHDRMAMKKELGDVLWMLAAIAHELGYSLDEIGGDNLLKLADRKQRGTIQGSGDDR